MHLLRLSVNQLCGRCKVLSLVGSQMSVCHNSNSASVTRIHRHQYLRAYPTLLVLPDGATLTIRYKEPRKIIKLPIDINALSEEEKQIRLARRKPKQKIIVQEEIEDTYDRNQYSHLWKKK